MGGDQVPVERITDALWPRIDSDYAHRSFNTTLHRLRKLLGDDRAIILSDGKVSLDKRRFWVDTWSLNAVSAASVQQLPVESDDLLAAAERVLTIYQGTVPGRRRRPMGAGRAGRIARPVRALDQRTRRAPAGHGRSRGGCWAAGAGSGGG